MFMHIYIFETTPQKYITLRGFCVFCSWREKTTHPNWLYFHDFAKNIALSFEQQRRPIVNMASFLFLRIQNGTLCFTGDVPRWNRRNSRCNRSSSVSKSYGTALQKYRKMCIKPAFPGEFETFISFLFVAEERNRRVPLGRNGTGPSPGLSSATSKWKRWF